MLFLLNRRMPHGLPCAGETALSERSMLSAPSIPVFAATGAALRDPAVFEQADSKDEARSVIQVWSYDPGVIGRDGVDGSSLFLSLMDVHDPRVHGERGVGGRGPGLRRETQGLRQGRRARRRHAGGGGDMEVISRAEASSIR